MLDFSDASASRVLGLRLWATMPSEGYLIVEFISEVCKADCQDSCGPHTVFGTGSSGHSLGKVTSEDSGMNGKRSTDGCLLSGLPPARL